MASSVQFNLPPVPVQKVSPDCTRSETKRKRLKEWQDLPLKALNRAAISQQAAAIDMEKSESWLSRALRGLEKLGWCDLGAIEDPLFWQELVQLMAEFHGVAFGGNEQQRADAEVGRRVRELFGLLR